MKLEHLKEKQKDLRQTIENEKTTRTQNNLIRLKQEGGAKSNTFSKNSKQILREKIQQSDTIDPKKQLFIKNSFHARLEGNIVGKN